MNSADSGRAAVATDTGSGADAGTDTQPSNDASGDNAIEESKADPGKATSSDADGADNARDNDAVSPVSDKGKAAGKTNDDEESKEDEGKDANAEDDDDQSDNDDDSSDSDSDEDGGGLSSYERKRLERIKRNQERLASLGLEQNKVAAMKAKATAAATTPKKKQGKPKVVPVQRSRLSRRTKAAVSYASEAPRWAEQLPSPKKRKKQVINPNSAKHRMERFIFDEFRHIESARRTNPRNTEKYLRWAENEVNYARRELESKQKKLRRQQEVDDAVLALHQDRRNFGGSLRELLMDIDRRMSDIITGIRQYDEIFVVSPPMNGNSALLVRSETVTSLWFSQRNPFSLFLTRRHTRMSLSLSIYIWVCSFG